MQESIIIIAGKTVHLFKLNPNHLKGLNIGEKLSFNFFYGNFRDVEMLFVAPKGSNPTPRKCAITAERLEQSFHKPVVFILNRGMTYERKRLMEKGVYFIMSDNFANLPMLTAMNKIPMRHLPSRFTPVAQYLLLYHLQVRSIEGISTKAIASLMPYSYESVSVGLTNLSELGLCEKVALDSKSKSIRFKSQGKRLWDDAKKYLINPVEHRVFCDGLSAENSYPICGINALAHFSALNPDSEQWLMMTKKEYKEVCSNNFIVNPNEFDGNIIIEIWKYPAVHSMGDHEKYVDRLSLALSLARDDEPRVEEEIEQMINNIKW